MNPIYKFELTANGTTQRAFPIYKDDLAKDFEKESGQEFFRAKLSGNLTFESVDYDRIVAATFDTQFLLEIFISYNAGQTWTSYWSGTFWKTDCDFDGDAKTVKVTPTVNDQYNDILAGMEKEYNLIELLPEIVPVKLDKRPMIQVYVPGQSVIACFLSGMWWEQECEPVQETDGVTIDDVFYPDLEYKYRFSINTSKKVLEISGSMSPQLPEIMMSDDTTSTVWSISSDGYTFRYNEDTSDPEDNFTYYEIRRNSDNVRLWYRRRTSSYEYPPQTVILEPVSGSGATGNVTVYIHNINVYARYVLDVDSILGLNTYPLPTDDLVENNRNYHRVIGYAVSDVIYFSARLVETPTQWGIYQPGRYYQQPYLYWTPELFPVARAGWGRVSIWFSFSAFDWLSEESGRAPYTLKDAFPLWSVISVLLNKVAPGLTHQNTTNYSQFLYGTNPITGINQTLMITPKSNIISAGYDQPAQKAQITLKAVMDMLRDCFRCYWFIDSQNRFRIEHIRYFMNGGTYSGTPIVGTDLTAEKVTRNNKEWAFARNQFTFDKPEMAARYQFGWMDDVTQLFEGYPIDIISKYVNPDNIEQIDVSRFTSDIDYILLNPGEISKDGFVLLGATLQSNYVTKSNTAEAVTGQNYLNTIQVSIPAGSTYRVRAAGNATIYGNSFWIYRDGVVTQDYVVMGTPSTFVAQQNITSIGIGVGGGAIDASGTITLYVDIDNGTSYKLPYYNFQIGGADHILQNPYVAFIYLQQYYAYDMPAYNYSINGVSQYAYGIKKLKTQTLKFPLLTDPDLVQLIKTNLGNGTIEKLSVNLSSRNANATLKYDTE